jgi:pimeloyl-ACP methyl ester carboxylesterase
MRRSLAFLVASCMFMAACADGQDDDRSLPAATDTTASTRGAGSRTAEPAVDWDDCGDLECATLVVPRSYAEPDGPTFELALARRPADGESIGSLLVNPGGPGAPGTVLVANAEAFLADELLERFDVVGWDPRGTGSSTSIDCTDDLDFFFGADHSPDDAAEVEAQIEAGGELARDCESNAADVLPYLSSSETVDDMESIRVALDEQQINYLGFSYGTLLGTMYADAYPDRVRAMVLDGAVDPTLGFEEFTRDQASAFDTALAAFLDDCARRDCNFGGDDPHLAFARLMAQIDAESLPGEVAGEARTLGPGEADIGVASALYYGVQGWALLGDALRDAARGDGSSLLVLADQYTGRDTDGEYDNSQEAFYGVSCLDVPTPPAPEMAAVAGRVAEAAPVFGASSVWLSVPCSVWPVPPRGAPRAYRAEGAPPIVVVGTSNDPATPVKWAEALASQLASAHLVLWRGEGHGALGQSDCVDDLATRYFVDLVPPARGTEC